ncbi:ATP-grasp domain-containing protein [Microcella daejeonensis]|uniref:biotin carboxylase n=1 Tax=Microcella daejeonensis TaxID=2994971 RepID=A0A9E8S852_9MICO|nr:biotin carboxylase N-terminal domain-containing protein [Microcella daejeonensis]WAB80873.1 ATP-grasp domain-containing protein [Microcella daejeonensis]
MPPFESVLVANRGEIACRIIRTLRRMGIRSIAVYSDADRDAPHVHLADEAVRLGPAPAAQSYLDVDAVVGAAGAAGASAVHPGYGFLSESPVLARACAEAGIALVGPGLRALEVMGDKMRAKAHVAAHGVPIIPGAGEPGMSDAQLVLAAQDVGVPLIVKPSAGGGGKGMTVVRDLAELPAALRTARRVALAVFGDDALLLERLIERPRHIEVQVLADEHGTTLSLGERECSLQRRHQKVIEEAPSPLLDDAARTAMGEAACAVARSVDYRGAGTVEFLVSDADPSAFFFMEMNTRLQVEHPVTELVTGIDLVEQQLRVAAGEALDLPPVTTSGWAIEARLCAEDAAFLPATGTVLALREPGGEGVRVDSGLQLGSIVTAHYDSLLAKIIVHGVDRAAALAGLDAALARTVVLGVPTNLGALRGLLADDDVRGGRLDTGLVERRAAEEAAAAPARDEAAIVAVALLAHEERERAAAGSGPWARPTGFRLQGSRPVRYVVADASGGSTTVLVSGAAGARRVALVDGAHPDAAALAAAVPARVVLDRRDDGVVVALDEVRTAVLVAHDDDGTVWLTRTGPRAAGGSAWRVRHRQELLAEHRATLDRIEGAVDPEVRASMPGSVVSIAVAVGDVVAAGAPLLVVEAMKMEHAVTAPFAGTVVELVVDVGDQVRQRQLVARVEALAEPAPPAPIAPTASAVPDGAAADPAAPNSTQREGATS